METKLSLSCETFSLLKSPLFISAFPSFVIFGQTISNVKYEEKKCFKIHFSEAYKWLLNFLCMGSFVMSDLDSAQANITEKDDEVYVWMGVTLIIKNEPKKVIKFIIEKQSIQIFETIFELEGSHDKKLESSWNRTLCHEPNILTGR